VYEGSFNNQKPKRISTKKHVIKEYNARNDVIDCSCGTFVGTEAEFYIHRGKKQPKYGTLDFLLDMPKARSSYPTSGTLLSHKSYRE
jgi:hypothetical protein